MIKLPVQISRLFSRFPTKLPSGMSQFNTWADSIIKMVGPIADNDSLRFVIASELLHSDAKRGSIPKHYFVSRLQKLAANQVAGQVLNDIKAKQAEEQAKLKQAEETAKLETMTKSAKETSN